jgi:hypothetical protein
MKTCLLLLVLAFSSAVFAKSFEVGEGVKAAPPARSFSTGAAVLHNCFERKEHAEPAKVLIGGVTVRGFDDDREDDDDRPPAAVAESSTVSMLVTGLIAVGWLRRRLLLLPQ